MKDVQWSTPTRGEFSFNEMIESIKQFISLDPNFEYQVIVGVDSQTHPRRKITRFTTTVTVRKVGKGAHYYYINEHTPMKTVLRDKIWFEAITLFNTIEEIREKLDGFISFKNIIPHADLGNVGKTKDLKREVRSLFIGNGYDLQFKPYSFGASTVADKHSK